MDDPPLAIGQVWWLSRELIIDLRWAFREPKQRPYLVVALAPPGAVCASTVFLLEGRSRDPRGASGRERNCLIVVAPAEAGTSKRTFFLLEAGRLHKIDVPRIERERTRQRAALEGVLPATRSHEIERMVQGGPFPVLRRIWSQASLVG